MFDCFKWNFQIHLPLRFARRQPPPERLARCPMSPYYIVFYDFDSFMFFVNFVARTKQKYASIVVWRLATTDKKGAGSEASSTMPHVAVVWGIPWFGMFECFKWSFQIHLPLRFARRQPPPERLARCPMSPYYIVFYDFDLCMLSVNFVAQTKQKYASIVVWRFATTDKKGAGSEASSAMPHVAVV